MFPINSKAHRLLWTSPMGLFDLGFSMLFFNMSFYMCLLECVYVFSLW